MRVLVCGGRNYDGDDAWNQVMDVLCGVHETSPISAIINGGALGADSLCRVWARMYGVKCVTVRADWETHGRAAGPIRNQRMLTEFMPDLVVAFPGGTGTADMISRAKAAGVPVKQVPSK